MNGQPNEKLPRAERPQTTARPPTQSFNTISESSLTPGDSTAETAPSVPAGSLAENLVTESDEIIPEDAPGNRIVRSFYHNHPAPSPTSASQPISAESIEPEIVTRLARLTKRLNDFLLGSPIKTEMAIHERISKVKALAVLSSDALSSVAYGTEASLAILVTAGLGFSSTNLLIGVAIIVLLATVAFSYRQTIMHYPLGGGSYIVARSHLGENYGLVAAAALLLDYILTVSVSVSAGVDALISAFPLLDGVRVALGVVFIGLIVLINLRGVRDSGSIFAIPTYLFIGSFALTLLLGIARAFMMGGPFAATPESHTLLAPATQSHLTIFLVLTAFASGCSAMTGTEAIADGVPVFQGEKPIDQSKNAATTLIWMASILAVLFAGTTYLVWRFGISPQPNSNPTLISQLAQLIYTRQWPGAFFYYFFQFSTTLILTLAANTSFSDFPRLSSILARDNFMPHSFGLRGGRLAFNTGILVLGVFSGLLLMVFRGNTDALINLYALGVFTAFTLSQSGMVAKWRSEREPGWQRGALISTLGAVATGLVTVIIIISKTPRGAWVVLILVPLIVLLFKSINRHYKNVSKTVENIAVKTPNAFHHHMIVPIDKLDKLALRGLAYARSLSPRVTAVHIDWESTPGAVEKLHQEWDELLAARTLRGGPVGEPADDAEDIAPPPPKLELVIIKSEYRLLYRPLIRYIDKLRRDDETETVTIVLPEYVTTHWWERLLHNQTAFRLKFGLLGRSVITTNVPYTNEPSTNERAGHSLSLSENLRRWLSNALRPLLDAAPRSEHAAPPPAPDATGETARANGHAATPDSSAMRRMDVAPPSYPGKENGNGHASGMTSDDFESLT